MLHTIKTVLTYPQASFPRTLYSKPGREISIVRFCTQPNMDSKKKNTSEDAANTTQHGDVMSHSFGEGYATRSDEEGFGGIYSGNQSLKKEENDIHEDHPAYDKTQGCEVKEKEKARHQPSANA